MAAVFPASQVIVVGGGLAGMSAANQAVESGGKTVLLDKSSFCGGNSTKATSGINGAGTKTQKEKGIPDNAEIFTADTLKGGAKRPELAKVLCQNSAADVDWLIDKFDLDLSLVARLGGHSQPRTHRGKERHPPLLVPIAEDLPPHACQYCRQTFTSRNKLFAHLKESGHSNFFAPRSAGDSASVSGLSAGSLERVSASTLDQCAAADAVNTRNEMQLVDGGSAVSSIAGSRDRIAHGDMFSPTRKVKLREGKGHVVRPY